MSSGALLTRVSKDEIQCKGLLTYMSNWTRVVLMAVWMVGSSLCSFSIRHVEKREIE